MIRPFRAFKPTVPTSCFIEETGIVIGDAVLGEHDFVYFHAFICMDPQNILIFCSPLEGEKVAS